MNCIAHSRKTSFDEMAYIDLLTSRGLSAHIEISWQLPGKMRKLCVLGSERIADCDCLNQKISVLEDEKEFELNVKANNTIESELKHFIDSIINNGKAHGFVIENSA